MSSRVTHYSLFWAAPPLLPPLSLTSLNRRPWQIPDLGLDNDPSSLHCNPFSFGRRLLDLRYRPDEPSRAAEGAGGRRRRRGGEAPAARPRWHAAHASGMRPAAVCTSASSGPAPCGCPSSPALWALVCAAFARSDALLCRLRARLVPFVSGWACRECTARTSNLLPLCVRKVAQTIVIMMNTYDSTCAVRDDKNSVRYRRQLRVRTVRTARMASTVSRRRGRARRPIGPIATDLTQPCGQTMTYITDTPGHTIATTTRSTRRARCSADRPKCASARANHTPESRQYDPLTRLYTATDYGTHPGWSWGRLGHSITPHARQVRALEQPRWCLSAARGPDAPEEADG